MDNKKAQIGSIDRLGTIVLILVTLGLIIGVGILIVSQTQDQLPTTTQRWNNISTTWTNNTYVALNWSCPISVNCLSVFNISDSPGDLAQTGVPLLGNGTWDCTIHGLRMINYTDDIISNPVGVTYDCEAGNIGYNSTQAARDTIQDIPGWIPIMIIVIIGGIIIGMVSYFRRA